MLTDEVFNRLLREEGAHYDAVRKSVPTILRDAKYDAAFAEIKAVEDLREKNFPGLTDNAPVSKLVSSMTTVPEFDTATAMKTVQDLRHNSKINLSATGDKAAATHELGLKQWNAAQELDGLIARNVEDAPNYLAKKAAAASKDVDSLTKKLAKVQQTAGLEQKKAAGMLGTDDEASVRALAEQRVLQQQLAQAQAVKTAAEEQLAQQPTGKRAVDHVISNYLSAREQFAKIYNVWDVTNTSTGEVNARGLAKLLGNDVPLSGELKDIADMARAFPKYFKTPQETGGVESYGVLDAAAASKGGLMALLAGLRYPMRKLVTSKGYQEEMYARDRDWVKHLPGAGQAGAAGNVANRIESDKDPTP
jgi:hypothetical protein